MPPPPPLLPPPPLPPPPQMTQPGLNRTTYKCCVYVGVTASPVRGTGATDTLPCGSLAILITGCSTQNLFRMGCSFTLANRSLTPFTTVTFFTAAGRAGLGDLFPLRSPLLSLHPTSLGPNSPSAPTGLGGGGWCTVSWLWVAWTVCSLAGVRLVCVDVTEGDCFPL